MEFPVVFYFMALMAAVGKTGRGGRAFFGASFRFGTKGILTCTKLVSMLSPSMTNSKDEKRVPETPLQK